MKNLIRASGVRMAFVGAILYSAGSGSAAYAHVVPVVADPSTPECSDGIDNDGDTLIDMSDPDCSSPDDISEAAGLPDFVPTTIGIDLITQWIAADIFDPGYCPNCGLTLIDFIDIYSYPLQELIEKVHPEWEVTLVWKVVNPIPGIQDSPNIPNLHIRYIGAQSIGPGYTPSVIQFSKLAQNLRGMQFVGQAIDINTNEVVTNIGKLGEQQQK